MVKKDFIKLLEKALAEIETLNYAEQFLDLFPDFFSKHLPISGLSVFILNSHNTKFIPYSEEKYSRLNIEPITWDSNVVIYLKNSQKTIVFRDENPARIRFLKKINPDLFEKVNIDIIIPLFIFKKLYGFVAIEANNKTYRELDQIIGFFKIFSNILIPLVISERAQIESSKNYFKIYKMDRLAMVGELAASAAHEIKNPLAGISTFLRYFAELEDFKKADIIDELKVMRQSVQRIDEIIKSLLSFSRYKKKKISKLSLSEFIETSLHSIALKIPANIKIRKEIEEDLMIETDSHQLQQILINILFNAIEAIGERKGEIVIRTYVSGMDQLPSEELFNISIKDNGPGIEDSFKEKLFQPFQTTKEEGTGMGLYTCYGLMKSLGGSINIISDERGTEVVISFPFSFEDEFEEMD
ncbi:MAG: HAMP domain-containing sensor histidine kinase [Candidatus Aminicenantes bacterium]|jgi:signal transduction histidine kinase